MPTRRAVLGAVGAGTAATAGCLGALGGPTCPEGELAAVDGEWPTRGRTAGHVGATDAGGFESALGTRWCVESDGRWTSLVLADGRLFVTERVEDEGTTSHYLHGREAVDGSRAWRVRLPLAPIAAPAVADGGVHLTMQGDDRTLVGRYATGDGSEEWRTRTEWRTDSMPAVADGTVYVTDVAGGLHAREAASGAHRWSTKVSNRVDPTVFGNLPAVVGGTAYVDAASGKGPAAVDTADGTVRWQRDVPGFHDPVTDGDLIVGGDGRAVYAVEAATGETRWTVERARPTTVPVVLAGDRVFAQFEGGVEALSASDGSRQWRSTPSDAVGSGTDVLATDGTLLVAGSEGLAGVDAASGEGRWEVDVEVDTVVAGDGVAFAFYGSRLRGLGVE